MFEILKVPMRMTVCTTIKIVNSKPEVAMPKNAPFALKHLFASGQNEQSARLRKISKGYKVR